MNLSSVYEPCIRTICREQEDRELNNERFYLVAVVGTTVSIISIFENTFLFALFAKSKHHRESGSFYLMLLALADVFVSGTYILLFTVKIIYIDTSSFHLQRLWMNYVVPMLTTSHIALTSASYLIVFATVERFSITISHRLTKWLYSNRKAVALFAVFIGVFSKGTMLLEIQLCNNPACDIPLGRYWLEPTALVVTNWYYSKLFRFWIRRLSTIVFPFFLLLLLNFGIITALRKNAQKDLHEQLFARTASDAVKKRKIKVKAATRTLVFVVFTYLTGNVLNVFICLWEYIDNQGLRENFGSFYTISVDVGTLLAVTPCVLRLPIYASCQYEMRQEILEFGSQLFRCRKFRNKMSIFEHYKSGNKNGALL